MSILTKKLQTATRASKVESICIDGDQRHTLTALEDEYRAVFLTAQQHDGEHPDDREGFSVVQAARDAIEAYKETMRDSLVSLKMYAASDDEWSRIKAKHPPQKDSPPLDQQQGFRTRQALMDVLVEHTKVLDGDEEHPIEGADVTELFRTVSGGDIERLKLCMLDLNAVDGFKGVGYLKAASPVTPVSG